MPIMNWKELRALNNQRFENNDVPIGEYPDWLDGWDPNAPDADKQYDDRLRSSIIRNGVGAKALKENLNEIAMENISSPQLTSEDIMSTGYGEEKIDKKIPFEEFAYNPTDTRANTQSWRKKIGNSIMNMTAVGLSTYADNTAGLVMGILGDFVDSVDDDGVFRLGKSFREGLGFADWMQQWRENSEEIFPVYRTIEEQADADHWWRHMNAAFWGDTVLKNIGFTLGAGAAFATYSWIPGSLAKSLADKGYKAAVAAASGDAKAVNTLRSIFSGAPIENPGKALKMLNNIQKSSNAVNWTGQLFGGIGGALGEARTEALMGAKEFRDEQMGEAARKYEIEKDKLGNLIDSDSKYSVNGVLTRDGEELWTSELQRIQDEYNASVDQIEKEADTIARRVFNYNMLILPMSNIIMFGKMAAGGFGTQSRARVKRAGDLYRAENFLDKAIGGIGTAVSEGLEEVEQKIISEGSKDIGRKNIAAFNNHKYDTDAIKDTSEWLMSMLNSAGNVLTDNTTWEEFAVGFLTGAGSSVVTGVTSGENDKYSALAADRINKIVNSKETMDAIESIVRHKSLDKIAKKALAEEDKFAWHEAEDAKLINAAVAFDKAGKLDDLDRIIDSFANVDEKSIDSIKGTLIDETDPDFSKKTDSQLVDWLYQRAKEVKKIVREYRGYHNTIDYLAYGTADEDAINELVYMRSQLENFEDRYNSILPKVIEDIKPHLIDVSKRVDKDGEPTQEARKAQELLASESDLTSLFGIAPSESGFEDSAEITTFSAPQIDNERQKKVLKTLEDWGLFSDKDDIRKEVEDLQKLVKSRQEYYTKLFDPTSIKSFAEKFNKDKSTPEKAAESIREEESEKNTAGLENVADVKNSYFSKNPEQRVRFLDDLNAVKDSNNAARQFLDEKSAYDTFRSSLAASAPGIVNSSTGGFSNVAEILLDDAFQKSNNEKELIDNLINSLPDVKQVSDIIQSRVADGTLTEEEAIPLLVNNQYDAAVKAIKEVAEKYKNTASKTEGRKVSATTTETKPEKNSKITGVDNPEPATESKPPKTDSQVKQPKQKPDVQPQQPEPSVDSVNKDAESPSVDSAIVDAADSYNDTTPDEDDATVPDRNGDSVLGYYQQSFPEIMLRGKKDEPNVFVRLKSLVNKLKVASDKKEVSRLNEQISMLVRDFVQFDKDGKPIGKNAAYGETYKWLKDNGAFDYIATRLNVNDELVFCYMSGCPPYDGVPQVVVGVVKSRDENGDINAVQPLATLSRPNSVSSDARVKYAYLDELYDAIQSDFDSIGPDGPLYVFGGKRNPKTSKVFGIRPGIIPFGGENNRIDQIEGYSDDAPIVIIGANNEPIVIRGNVKDSDKLFIPTRNNATNRYGQMYYMVRNGGSSYTPIALGRKSLSKDVFDSAKEGGFVDGIKQTIAKIDNLLLNELTDTNAKELNDSKLSPILKELNTKMVLKDVHIEFKNILLDNGTSANGLLIEWGKGKDENAFIEPTSNRNTLDVLASLNRPVQLSPLDYRREDTIKNLPDVISDGLIDTNAEAMRQKGVNFMFDPWNPATAKFERMLGPASGADDIAENNNDSVKSSSPVNDSVSNDNVEASVAVAPVGEKSSDGLDKLAKVSDINDAIGKSYDDLSKEFKDTLESNGVSKDIWDSSDSETRQAFLEC